MPFVSVAYTSSAQHPHSQKRKHYMYWSKNCAADSSIYRNETIDPEGEASTYPRLLAKLCRWFVVIDILNNFWVINSSVDLLFYIEGCVDPIVDPSLLNAFQAPTDATISEVLAYESPLLHNPTLIAHKDVPRDFFVIIQILSTLVPSHSEAQYSRLDYRGILDCVSRLWLIATARKDVMYRTTLIRSSKPLLELLHTCVSILCGRRSERTACLIAGKLLCQLLGSILQEALHKPEELPNPNLQLAMCWSIACLFSSCIKVPELSQVYYEHLEHWVTETIKRRNIVELYSNDLQVRIHSTLFEIS